MNIDLGIYLRRIECAMNHNPPRFEGARHALLEAEQAYYESIDQKSIATDQEILDCPIVDCGVKLRTANKLDFKTGAIYVRDLMRVTAKQAEEAGIQVDVLGDAVRSLGENFCTMYGILDGFQDYLKKSRRMVAPKSTPCQQSAS